MKKVLVGIGIALGLMVSVPALALAQAEPTAGIRVVAGSSTPQDVVYFNKMVPPSGGGMMWNTPYGGKQGAFGMMAKQGSFRHDNSMFFLGAFAHIVTVLLVWTLLVLLIIILLKKIKDHSGK